MKKYKNINFTLKLVKNNKDWDFTDNLFSCIQILALNAKDWQNIQRTLVSYTIVGREIFNIGQKHELGGLRLFNQQRKLNMNYWC